MSLYSGVGAVCIGVGPEKAIKLTVNDLCRERFLDRKTGKVPLHLQLVSGGLAGCAQTIFTNPPEIVKIRMQLKPEMSAAATISDIGIRNLYKG